MQDIQSSIKSRSWLRSRQHAAVGSCWVLIAVLSAACGGGGPSQARCGDGKCEGGERCEDCPSDCGQCNVCGDGKCSVTEIENCNTCPQDCACPDIGVCARELTLRRAASCERRHPARQELRRRTSPSACRTLIDPSHSVSTASRPRSLPVRESRRPRSRRPRPPTTSYRTAPARPAVESLAPLASAREAVTLSSSPHLSA
jgi:hypothetical protein